MKNVKDFKTFLNESEGTQYGAPQDCCSPEVKRMAQDLIESCGSEMAAYHNDESHDGTAEDYTNCINEMLEGINSSCNEMMMESTPNTSGSEEGSEEEEEASEAPADEPTGDNEAAEEETDTPADDDASEEEENEETY